MLTPRRGRDRRKKLRGVSDFIRGQLVMLENFARVLNGELLAGSAAEGRLERESAEYQGALSQAGAVVAAVMGAKASTTPAPAVAGFNALAAGQPLEYAASTIFRRGPLHWLQVDSVAGLRLGILLGSPSWRGAMTVWVADYFRHPHRDRLRQCQQCARWFADLTRNKSARRCSKACTVAWSNKQRTGKGGYGGHL